MKKKYVALKMYLIGITLGLFVWVWSGVTHLDATQSTSASQTVAGQTLASTTTVQTASTSRQSSSVQPRIRTRTS